MRTDACRCKYVLNPAPMARSYAAAVTSLVKTLTNAAPPVASAGTTTTNAARSKASAVSTVTNDARIPARAGRIIANAAKTRRVLASSPKRVGNRLDQKGLLSSIREPIATNLPAEP